MATTPIKIQTQITDSATDLYTAFTGAASWAEILSLDLQNVTDDDVTVDIWVLDGATLIYLADNLPIPARGHASWRGLVVLDGAGDKLRGQASVATSIDVLGAVLENA